MFIVIIYLIFKKQVLIRDSFLLRLKLNIYIQLIMDLLYKDTNQIIFDCLSLDDKYSFHKYSEKYNKDNLEFTQQVITDIKNMNKAKWAKICYKNNPINSVFVDDHIDKIKWKVISHFPKLSEEFIERYMDLLDIDMISYNQTLSIGFIKKYQNKLVWHMLCWNKNSINKDVILEFQDQLDWDCLSEWFDFDSDLLIKFDDKINHTLRDINLHY